MRRIGTVLVLAALAAAQDEVKDVLKQATEKLQAKEYDAALALLDTEKFPDSHEVWQTRGLVKMNKGDHEDAVADLTKAVELGAEGWVFYLRGDGRRRLCEPEAALAAYYAWLEKKPRHPDGWFHRGLVRETLGDFEGAIQDYSTLGLLAPNHYLPYLNRAYAKCRIGRYKDALGDFEGAIFTGATGPEVYISRARARHALGDDEGAAADLAAAEEQNAGTANLHATRGRYWFDRGEYLKAKADLAKAVEIEGGEEQEYTRLYLVLAATRAGEGKKAQADLAAYLKKREKKDDWYATLAGFLAGTVPEEELLKKAAEGKKQVAREHECEAYWYAGAQRAAAGDKEKALEYVKRSKAADIRNFIEYESAEAELARLEK